MQIVGEWGYMCNLFDIHIDFALQLIASRCPVSRLQPICSQDGVTNFYSPCSAGCKSVETVSYIDQVALAILTAGDFV